MNPGDKYEPLQNRARELAFLENTIAQEKKKKIFDNLKQDYLSIMEIIRVKHVNQQSDEAEQWKQKLNQCWLQLTEFLAEDWGYQVDTFRELWNLKQPVPQKVLMRSQAYEQWKQSVIANAPSYDQLKINMDIKLGKIKEPQLDFFVLTQRTVPPSLPQHGNSILNAIANFFGI